MKVRPSVNCMCYICRIVRRHGVVPYARVNRERG